MRRTIRGSRPTGWPKAAKRLAEQSVRLRQRIGSFLTEVGRLDGRPAALEAAVEREPELLDHALGLGVEPLDHAQQRLAGLVEGEQHRALGTQCQGAAQAVGVLGWPCCAS